MKNYFLDRRETKVNDKVAEGYKSVKDREISLCVEKWEKTGYLDGLSGHRRGQMAVILENQSLWDLVADKDGFGDIGIKLVHKIYRDFLAFETVSVQTMLGPTDRHFNYRYFEDRPFLYHGNIFSRTRKLKTFGDLTEEGICDLSRLVREELEREIFCDLRANCGTVSRLTNPTDEEIGAKLVLMRDAIRRKAYSSENSAMWLVTSPEIAFRLANSMCFIEREKPVDGIYYWGVLKNAWKLIVDPLSVRNVILVGQSDGGYNAGYNYCPYVGLCTTPRIVGGLFRPGYLVRYGKRLSKWGRGYYGKIEVN